MNATVIRRIGKKYEREGFFTKSITNDMKNELRRIYPKGKKKEINSLQKRKKFLQYRLNEIKESQEAYQIEKVIIITNTIKDIEKELDVLKHLSISNTNI